MRPHPQRWRLLSSTRSCASDRRIVSDGSVTPRISVIIPAYNAEPYLVETLDSVAAQTYGDWEVIVADDASTDATVAVATAFSPRVTVLPGTLNAGPATARNRALAVASGELLAFLDADDIWRPDYLERVVALHDESRTRGVRVGLVACDARILGPEGLLPQTFMDIYGVATDVTVAKMLVSSLVFGGAVAPAALVDEVGGFCPDLFGTEDYDLWLRILELGYRVVVTREALTTYRRHPSSVSTNTARMARSLQVTYRRALGRGRLTPREARIARRQLRLQRVVEQLALSASARRAGEPLDLGLARQIPLILRVAAENPNRWANGVRLLSGRAPANRL